MIKAETFVIKDAHPTHLTMAHPDIPTVKFNNGREIPIFGLGTWKVSSRANLLRFCFLSFITTFPGNRTAFTRSDVERQGHNKLDRRLSAGFLKLGGYVALKTYFRELLEPFIIENFFQAFDNWGMCPPTTHSPPPPEIIGWLRPCCYWTGKGSEPPNSSFPQYGPAVLYFQRTCDSTIVLNFCLVSVEKFSQQKLLSISPDDILSRPLHDLRKHVITT
uniref:Uncharacterized protein n=1 Tax=Timema douglasi TaxID=61478 RepID=A0A7R8VM81_TIMDO|nr:unnamed protein product [Timema douglasi]